MTENNLTDPPAFVRHPTAFAQGVGIEYLTLGEGRSSLKIPYQEKLISDASTGAIHTGLITSLLDHSSGGAVFSARKGQGHSVGTLDLRVDFMRPSEPGQDITAAAHCYAISNGAAFVRSTCYHTNPDEPIATSAAVFMIAKKPREEGGNIKKVRAQGPVEQPELTLGQTDIAQRLAKNPYADYLAVRHGINANDESVFVLQYSPHLIGNPTLPALHGGVLSTFLEVAATQQLWAQTGTRPKLLNVEIDFLRSGRPVDTYAIARVRKLGRQIAIVEAQAWQTEQDRPITMLHAHFMLNN